MHESVHAESLWLTMDDGAEVYVRVWEPAAGAAADSSDDAPAPPAAAGGPRAVLQLAAGMTEHSGRYDAFARLLAGRGFAAAGNDHRVHCPTGAGAAAMRRLADA